MCGRFDRHSELEAFADLIEGLVLEPDRDLPANYNVAPSHQAWVSARGENGLPKVRAVDWGLVPGWVKKTGMSRPINARVETAHEKPMFRQAFSKRRCVVLCDGYYEWCKTATGKQPFYFHMPDHAPFVMAGLWETNAQLFEEPRASFCILTRAADEGIARIHHRMPVIADQNLVNEWLNPAADHLQLQQMAMDKETPELEFYAVDTLVNKPDRNGPECIQPMVSVNQA